MKAYLRIGNDALDRAKRYRSKRDAIAAFERVARELDRYGQAIEGSLHYALNRDQLNEYPDFVLSLGPRGGIKVEHCC